MLADFELKNRRSGKLIFWNVRARTHSDAEEGRGDFDCVIANPPYVRTQVLGGSRLSGFPKNSV